MRAFYRGFLHKPENRVRGFLHRRLLRGFLLRGFLLGAHLVRGFFRLPNIIVTNMTHNFQISELKIHVISLRGLLESTELKQVDKDGPSNSGNKLKVCTSISHPDFLF